MSARRCSVQLPSSQHPDQYAHNRLCYWPLAHFCAGWGKKLAALFRLNTGRVFGVLHFEREFNLLHVVLGAVERGGYCDDLKGYFHAALNVSSYAERKSKGKLAQVELLGLARLDVQPS